MSGASSAGMAAAPAGPPGPAPRAPRPGRPRTLSCPNCGGSIQVRAAGLSISAACASCGSVVDVASDDLRIIGEARQRTREPDIPVGRRGDLAGATWEVVGYQVRSNPQEGWSWEEYLLFNPYYGFRFLAHDDEGWTLYCMLRGDVPDPARGVGDGKRYAQQRAGTARTDYVLGEFYWRVRVGDTVATLEYAAPPYTLSREESGQEIIWSRGVKVPDGVVRQSFLGPAAGGPAPGSQAAAGRDAPATGPAAAQRARTTGILATAAAAFLLLVLLHLTPFGRQVSEAVFARTFRVSLGNRGQVVATEPFTIPFAGGNVRIAMQSPIRNDRLDLSVSLTAEGSGRTFETTRTIESYATGGNLPAAEAQTAIALFAEVPGGEYRLLVEADTATLAADARRSAGGAPGPDEQGIPFTITVQRHVPVSDFFWAALAALLAYPLWHVVAAWWRRTQGKG